VIVDAGANIGLASVFLANKYPEARIIAIEPEKSNFEVLRKNVAPYANVACVQAALWNSDKSVTITDLGLGQWGFFTMEHPSQREGLKDGEVEGITVTTLMTRFGIEYIDFFKVDVEGAEKEVFASSSSWIDRVGVIAIELHERLKVGCSRSVYLATKDFQWEFRRGETIFMGKGECSASKIPESTAALNNSRFARVGPRVQCQIVAVH
jgi:FkbM family methyltransferase